MKKIYGYVIGAVITTLSILFGVHVASANPSVFTGHTATATATTTVTTLRYGIATSTLAINWNNASSNNYKIDKALVVFQAEASTSQNQIVNAQVQYSIDGVDWYAQTEATTTFSQFVEKTNSFTIATSSDQIASSTSAVGIWRVHKSFVIDTPTPYVRVKFFVNSGANPVNIWADYQPIKEVY